MQIKWITTDKIRPNDYNPNVVSEAILAKLRQEIAQKGLCEPIIVREIGEGYTIVDGEHRWRICKELGLKEVPCIVQDYDDKEAKIKTIQLNYMHGSAVPIRLAHLIHDLNKEIKLEDLEKRLPYEKVKLMDDLELLKLPDDFGKDLEQRSAEEEEELPTVISFVAYREQSEAIEKALAMAIEESSNETKNPKTEALARICSYFIENKEDIGKTGNAKRQDAT